MADNKKYYYLKLKDNFYDSEQMIILQNMQDGYLYSDILMKLYLRSLKTEGKLMFNNIIPYTPQVLAQVVRHQVGTVEKALKIFKDLGLIDVLDNGAIYMLDIQNFIGKSSTEADRIRNYRQEIKQEQLVCTNVQEMYDKNTPEIEIEIELEKDIEIENKVKSITTIIENNYNRTISPIEYEKIKYWLSLFDEKIIKYAIEISTLNNKKTFNYVNGILKNWKSAGYKTLEEVKEDNKYETSGLTEEQKNNLKEIEEYEWFED